MYRTTLRCLVTFALTLNFSPQIAKKETEQVNYANLKDIEVC